MRFNHLQSLAMSGALAVLLLGCGFVFSQKKMLWNDEIFTQKTVVDSLSFGDIARSRTPEGNKNPLFYLIQKAVCNLFSYHLPFRYSSYDRIRDIPSQVIMRIPSNIYMSLSLALIFYFFTRYYSLGAGLFALATALVSPMVWMYWVEARPYPLWFLLTTAQLLLLCMAVVSSSRKILPGLFAVHLLLALTISASMFQITIVFLFLCWRTKADKLKLFLLWVIPLAIDLAYYLLIPAFKTKTYLFFPNLFDAVQPERLFVYVIYAMAAWLLPKQRKTSHVFFLPVFFLFFASAVFMLFVELFTPNSQFGFFSRYLIFLTPADILMFSLASIDFYRWSRPYFWLNMNVSIFLGGLVVIRGLITYRALLASAMYLHSPG